MDFGNDIIQKRYTTANSWQILFPLQIDIYAKFPAKQ